MKGDSTPHLTSRFYLGFLVLVAVSYALQAYSWMGDSSDARVAGVEWVANWMSPDVVSWAWGLGALAAILGAVVGLLVPRETWSRNLVIVSGVLTVAVPLLLGAVFFGSWIVFLLDDPAWPPPSSNQVKAWHDLGSPRGWKTTVVYWSYASWCWWVLAYETGTLALAGKLLRQKAREGGSVDK